MPKMLRILTEIFNLQSVLKKLLQANHVIAQIVRQKMVILGTGQLTGTTDGQLAHGLLLPGVLVLTGHLD